MKPILRRAGGILAPCPAAPRRWPAGGGRAAQRRAGPEFYGAQCRRPLPWALGGGLRRGWGRRLAHRVGASRVSPLFCVSSASRSSAPRLVSDRFVLRRRLVSRGSSRPGPPWPSRVPSARSRSASVAGAGGARQRPPRARAPGPGATGRRPGPAVLLASRSGSRTHLSAVRVLSSALRRCWVFSAMMVRAAVGGVVAGLLVLVLAPPLPTASASASCITMSFHRRS